MAPASRAACVAEAAGSAKRMVALCIDSRRLLACEPTVGVACATPAAFHVTVCVTHQSKRQRVES